MTLSFWKVMFSAQEVLDLLAEHDDKVFYVYGGG
jgi:hypothetical protein